MLGPRDPKVCSTCFWAFPDDYKHIATEQIRRTHISWQGKDVAVFDRLHNEALQRHTSVPELIKEMARQRGKSS